MNLLVRFTPTPPTPESFPSHFALQFPPARTALTTASGIVSAAPKLPALAQVRRIFLGHYWSLLVLASSILSSMFDYDSTMFHTLQVTSRRITFDIEGS